jgi:diguanylate cyclase (GGDEF)-like protein
MVLDPYADILAAPDTPPTHRRARGPYDDILSGESTPSIEDPGPGPFSSVGKTLETLTYPLTLPKRGIDALARAGARAQGINVPDDATTGWMVREAAGLDPKENADSYAGRLGGKALEMGADLATDPLTYALAGGGKAARVAAAAFAPSMLAGAYNEGKRAIDVYGRQGLTPEAAELAMGAGISGAMGLGAASHAIGGEHVAPVAPEAAIDAAPEQWSRPTPPEFAQTPTLEQPAPVAPPVWDGPAVEPEPLQPFRSPEEVRADQIEAEQFNPARQTAADQAMLDQMQGRPPAVAPQDVVQPQEVPSVLPEASSPQPPAPEMPAGQIPPPQETVTPVDQRVTDRRTGEQPVADDRRTAQRRAVAEQLGLPEDHPAVERVVAAEKEARTDVLTGLGNKRAWDEIQGTVTPDDQVVMIDGKKFKAVNDRFGHPAGDAVLKNLGNMVRDIFGEESARQGGDEFGAVLRKVTPEEADAYVEKMKARAAESRVQFRNPATGEILDIPPVEVHIAKGTNEAVADAAVNDVAAASRKGGRGDGPLTDQAGNPAHAAAPGLAGAGLGDGSPELVPPKPEPGGAAPASAPATPPKYDASQARVLAPITIDHIKRAFVGRDVSPLEDGAHEVRLANGRSIRVQTDGAIELDPAAFKAGYDREAATGERAVGSFQRIGPDAIIRLAKEGADQGTVDHEAFHAAMDMVLSAKEKAAVLERYKTEEAAAEAYSKWEGPGAPTNGLFSRIAAFFQRIYRAWKPSAESTFGKVRSGEAFGRDVAGEASAPKYATATMPPDVTAAKERIEGKPADVPVDAKPEEPAALGRPMEAVEAPRVDAKVEALREVAPDAKLSRDEPRSWESLDPQIKKRLRGIQADPMEESRLYNRAKKGTLDDVDVQVLDGLVAGKREAYDAARENMLKAGESGAASKEYLAAALDVAAADFAKAARSDVEAGTKLARALAARARVMESQITASSPDAFLKQVFRQIPDISDKDAGALVQIMKDKPSQLQDALHIALNPKLTNKLLEFWKAGLVSAPGTQVANVLGNIGEQAMRLGETATSALIDPLFGKGRTRLGGEARFELAGGLKGAGRALVDLGSGIKDAFLLEPEEIKANDHLEHQVGAIGGKAGRAVRIPFRLLSAFDDFFKTAGGEAELHKLAYREAGGDAAAAQKIIANPSAELLAKVRQSQLERTFQNPNESAQAIINLRNKNKLFEIVMPFVKTPANIARMTWERSPAGFGKGFKAWSEWRDAVKSGKDAAEVSDLRGKAVDALARPLLGTGLMLTFGALAKAGHMTGQGPVDPKDKNALRDSGWQPYSFVFDGKDGKKTYVPFNRFEPVSGLLGFAADMVEAKDAKSANDFFAAGIGSVVQNLASKTYLQGLADAAGLIKDPAGAGSNYISSLAGSIVPNIVAKTAQAIDPAVRETKATTTGLTALPERIKNTIESRLPGLSERLPEKHTALGGDAERPGNAVSRFLSPIQATEDKDTAVVTRKLVELDAVPSAPPKDISVKGRKVPLTPAEQDQIDAADVKATKQVEALLSSSSFRRQPEEMQRQIVRSTYERLRNAARAQIVNGSDFRRRAREVKAAR